MNSTAREPVMIDGMIEQAGGAIAPTDRAIANAVGETIARDIPYHMPHIDIAVEDGHVTLRGAVTGTWSVVRRRTPRDAPAASGR